MGSYQSRTSHVLQDVWREEWEQSYANADKSLSSEVRALTSGDDAWPEGYQLALNGDAKVLEGQLQSLSVADLNRRTEDGWALIHVCSVSKNGGADAVRLLVARDVDVNVTTKSGFSALHLAAFVGSVVHVEALLSLPKTRINAKGFHNLTPLHIAAFYGHEDVARVLLAHQADVTAADQNTFQPLHIAAHMGHVGVADVLLAAGAPVNAASHNGETPLHLACARDHRAMAELLVVTHKADVNASDREKHTPLHYCARGGFRDIVKLLIDNRAEVNSKNVYLDTPLHCACYNGRVGTCQELLSRGAQLTAENYFSETPLHAACTAGAPQTMLDIILADRSMSIDCQGRDGHTPLHSACYHGHFHLVKALLERGANYRLQDKKGATPIKWAFERGYDRIVELLRTCYKSDEETGAFETPSPLGRLRNVTQDKIDILQLRSALSDVGQINVNELDFMEVIGRGSFGAVYKGKYKNRTIAIKKVQSGNLRARSDVERFCREVKILCDLNHPNVIRFIGACTKEPSHFCILIEYARGGSLNSILHKDQQVLDTPRKIGIALDVARGMEYLHSLPIIHRDLNPHNILLNEKGTALVADFGEARLLMSGQEDMTKQLGHLRYMAPEVFMQSSYSEKADVFSYALCIWELFTAMVPFSEHLAASAAAEMAYNKARPPLPDTWPAVLTDLIKACWADDPSERPPFSSIVQTLEACKDLTEPLAPPASEPASAAGKGAMTASNRSRSLTLATTSATGDYVATSQVSHMRTRSFDTRSFALQTGLAGEGAGASSSTPPSQRSPLTAE